MYMYRGQEARQLNRGCVCSACPTGAAISRGQTWPEACGSATWSHCFAALFKMIITGETIDVRTHQLYYFSLSSVKSIIHPEEKFSYRAIAASAPRLRTCSIQHSFHILIYLTMHATKLRSNSGAFWAGIMNQQPE